MNLIKYILDSECSGKTHFRLLVRIRSTNARHATDVKRDGLARLGTLLLGVRPLRCVSGETEY